MTESLVQTAIRELGLEQCICGAHKERRQSFCKRCYFALPQKLRSDLYKPLSDGYAEIYDEAKDWLQHNTDRLNQVKGLF
jgi:hypothetical protein